MQILREHLKNERGRLKMLAAALHINSSAISQWTRVPAEKLVQVSQATGLPLHDLRPDMFPPPPKPKRKRSAS